MTLTTTATTSTTAATPATATPATTEAARSVPRLRTALSSFRVRLVLRSMMVLALATAASVAMVRVVVQGRVDRTIEEDLHQEIAELRRFATGRDPRTGRPFGDDIERLFTSFLRSDVPQTGEVALTFVEGRPYKRSRQVMPYALDRNPRLVDLWGGLTAPRRGRVDTPAGEVDYLAVPVRSPSGPDGVYVIAVFRAVAGREVSQLTLAAAAVGAIVLVIGSLLAGRVAHRALEPVEEVTATARAISDSDLSRRIEVSGDDEIARLARTFNDMLDRLKRAFDAQRNFISDAGHELRTPITIVTGHLETLDDDPAERARTVELLLGELDRMARMVDDLLLLARAERPDFLRPSEVDLVELLHDVADKAKALGPRRWTLDRVDAVRLRADPQRLTQALMQLVHNAVRHTGPDDVVALGAATVDSTVRLWVRDTGAGIAEADLGRIFDRFTRGSGAGRSGEGVGLGLAIVKAIAEAHGGRVEVTSAPREGSTFVIVLPLDTERARP